MVSADYLTVVQPSTDPTSVRALLQSTSTNCVISPYIPYTPQQATIFPYGDWPSKAKMCDHCYCRPSTGDETHRECCKCADTRLKAFVGKDGRAKAAG